MHDQPTRRSKAPVTLLTEMEVPDQLVNELRNRRLVVFIGAGISQKMGMPCWDSFLERLVKQFRYDRPATFARLFPDNWRSLPPASLTSLLRETMGSQEFYSACRNQLARYDFRNVPRFLSLLARLPFQFYVTTNFDKVMEYTYFQEWDRMLPVFNFPRMEDLSSVFRQHGPCLVKLHGDIDLPESLVVTDEDYDRLTGQGRVQRFLRNLTTNYSILFIGYSFSDPYLRDILTSLHRGGESMPHYTITQDPLDHQNDLTELGVEPVPLRCGPTIDQTSDLFMAKLATLYWTGVEGSRQVDRGHGRECQALLDEQESGLTALRTLSLPELEFSFITAASSQDEVSGDLRIYGVSPGRLEPLSPHLEARAVEMYPASVLDPSASGVLVLWTRETDSDDWQSFMLLLGHRLEHQEIQRGSRVRLEDLDGDGRIEILLTREPSHPRGIGLTEVFRLEENRLHNVTFESTRTLSQAMGELNAALLGRAREDLSKRDTAEKLMKMFQVLLDLPEQTKGS